MADGLCGKGKGRAGLGTTGSLVAPRVATGPGIWEESGEFRNIAMISTSHGGHSTAKGLNSDNAVHGRGLDFFFFLFALKKKKNMMEQRNKHLAVIEWHQKRQSPPSLKPLT